MIDSMPTVYLATFTGTDWTVLAVYFLLLVFTGYWFSRRQQHNTQDYFLAGRRIPAWAAAMSLMATALSGATFIGTPYQSYKTNLTYVWSYAGQVLAALIVASLFIPAFYRRNVTTVYELLDSRCGPNARRAASAMFMIGRIFASGARLYIAALAAAMILFGNTHLGSVTTAIAILTVVGIFYTLIGGIAAVVWTDVIQACVFIFAVIAAIVLLKGDIPADTSQIVVALADDSKLTTFTFFGGFDPAFNYTLLTAIFGHMLIGLGAFGTDQDLTQRLLTCPTAGQARRAAISGVLMTVPVAFLFLVVGLLLYVFYQRPDLMGGMQVVAPSQPKDVFLTYITHQLPAGLGGLMIAGLMAAALSSTNSELNAMSSTAVCDFYRPLRPGRSEKHYLAAGRWGVALWGVALGGFAVFSAYWHGQKEGQTLIDFALGVMTFAYSGLVGVFLTVLLTKRGNTTSVIAALLTGFTTVCLLNIYANKTLAFPWHMTIATTLAFLICLTGNPKSYNPPR